MPELSHRFARRVVTGGSRRRALVAPMTFALVGGLLLGACTNEEPEANEPSTKSSSTAQARNDGLDDLFADSDGDGIPDRVQKSMGEDTQTDACASKVCPSEAKQKTSSMAKIIKGTSTMLIFDSSGSMVSKTNDGQTRMAAAKKAVHSYVENSPRSTERLGMMVYGHEGSNKRKDRKRSCAKIDTLQSVGELNGDNVGGTLDSFEPTGWTPLGASIRAASKEFDNERNRINKIIVVTDGIDECGGNPEAEARKLRRSGFNVKIDVVGMGVENDSPASGKLQRVASATGGDFTAVKDSAGIQKYFDGLLGEWVATAKVGDCVGKNFASYSTCQALRWQKAQVKLNAEVKKLRKEGKNVPAKQLQKQVNSTATYYATTLTTRGLTAVEDFSPESDEVKKIEKHLEKSADGRAVLDASDVPCSKDG